MPAVSVIIPVYNIEKYITQCLESVINQTLFDIEIIIVSDGPKSCNKICEEYAQKDKRITLIKDIKQGLGGARNAGLKKAQGKYVFFLDGDDWLTNKTLEKLYLQAEQNASDMVFFQASYVSETGKKLAKQDSEFFLPFLSQLPSPLNFSWKDILFKDIFNIRLAVVAWNKLYNKEFLQRNNLLFPVNTRYEDNEFFFKAFFQAKSISALFEKLYFYRQVKTSLAHTNKKNKNCFDIIKIWANIKNFTHKELLLDKSQIETINRRIIQDFSKNCRQLPAHLQKEFLLLAKKYFDIEFITKLKEQIGNSYYFPCFWLPIIKIQKAPEKTEYTFLGLLKCKIKK